MNKSKIGVRFDWLKGKANYYKPEMLLGAGLALFGKAIFDAIKATNKNYEEKEEINEDIEYLCTKKEKDPILYSDSEFRKDITEAYKRKAKNIVKTYGKTVVEAIIASLLLIKSHQTMRENEAHYAMLAAALTQELKNVYSRIDKKVSPELAEEIKYGVENKEVTETVTDENGKEKEVKSKRRVISPDYHGYYTYKWDRNRPTFKHNKLLRDNYRLNIQRYLNDMLDIRMKENPDKIGWIWLEDVVVNELQMMDKPTEAMHDCGWLKYQNAVDNVAGDNYIEIDEFTAMNPNPDTGIFEEEVFWTFNVDGPIRRTLFR